jgi:hypothetical protein
MTLATGRRCHRAESRKRAFVLARVMTLVSSLAASEAGASDRARLQNRYVQRVCVQAGQSCRTDARDWQAFVQAGMNDIDRRCDNFLKRLDNARRAGGVFSESTTTAASIESAGAALGLKPQAFSLVRSRLSSKSQSAVQAVVLARQRDARSGLSTAKIPTKTAAIQALRIYLCACTPAIIEAGIAGQTVPAGSGGCSWPAQGRRPAPSD